MGDGRQNPPERAVNAFAARVIFMVFMRISKRMNRSGDPRGISPPPTTCLHFVCFVYFVVQKNIRVDPCPSVVPKQIPKHKTQAARVEPRQPTTTPSVCFCVFPWFLTQLQQRNRQIATGR
jgi:hypothetical protein